MECAHPGLKALDLVDGGITVAENNGVGTFLANHPIPIACHSTFSSFSTLDLRWGIRVHTLSVSTFTWDSIFMVLHRPRSSFCQLLAFSFDMITHEESVKPSCQPNSFCSSSRVIFERSIRTSLSLAQGLTCTDNPSILIQTFRKLKRGPISAMTGTHIYTLSSVRTNMICFECPSQGRYRVRG